MDYAESTNWMSSIGSAVASKASNALAQKLGTELGKKPQGDLGIPLTDFDTVMHESYKTQASATLGLQANKLITDSNIEMAKAPRVTSDMIARTNKSISIGLQNIIKQAPAEIQPHLEYQYGNVQLNQIEALNNRMIQEQKQDDRNNTIASTDVNAEKANSLGISGNREGAMAFVRNTEAINKASLALKTVDPKLAKVNIDTVRQSAKSGLLIHDYETAKAAGKGEQFLKDVADKADKSDPDYMAVTNNLMQHVNHQNAMRQEQEALTMTKFESDLVQGIPMSGSRLQQLQSDLSPINYQKTMLGYYKYLQKNSKENEAMALANAGFDKPEVFAKTTDDVKNRAYDERVRSYIQSNPGAGLGEAEAHVAAQAAGPVPHFTTTVNAQMKSIDPAQVEDAIQKMEYLYKADKGDNLYGVTDEAKLSAATYEQLRRSLPPIEAVKEMHDRYYNIKEEEKKIIDNKWNTLQKSITDSPGGSLNYYASIVGFDPAKLSDPIAFEASASLLMASNFYTSRADLEVSKKVLIRDMQQTYGESNANGVNQITYFPVEKAIGLPSNAPEEEKAANPMFSKYKINRVNLSGFKPFSSAGLIQDDIIGNVSSQLEPINQQYKEGNGLFHFEIEPRPSIEWAKKNRYTSVAGHENEDRLEMYSNGSPMVIHRVWRNGTRETYRLMVKANPTLTQLSNGSNYKGAWDVVVVSDTGGFKPLSSIVPNLNQSIYYRPDSEKIRNDYLKYYGEFNG